MTEKHKSFIYLVQILFVSVIAFGSQSLQLNDVNNSAATVARYVLYLILIKASEEACHLGYSILRTKHPPDLLKALARSKPYLILLGASIAVVVCLKQQVFQTDCVLLLVGYLISRYPEMEDAPNMVNYGTGMALSYIEGYLVHVIPSDGADLVGLVENLTTFEAKHGIVVPVKRLFIVITKSLYGPPDLKHFNKPNRDDLSYLEARQSLQDVRKDVAGVKNRTYRVSVYKIHRAGAAPVSLAAECATPLHTLHRVAGRRLLYEHLANVDLDKVASDFCTTLQSIINKSPDYRGKCELVYYDDTDPNQNLADVLLNRVRQLEPNFENIRRN